MTEYIIALVVVMALSVMERSALYTSLIIAVNFCINETYVKLSGVYDPWVWFSLVDGVTAIILLSSAFGRIGCIVSAMLCTQQIMHWAYGLSNSGNADIYWQSLTAIAFLQLAIVAGGAIYGGGRRYRGFSRIRRVPPLDNPAHSRATKPREDR